MNTFSKFTLSLVTLLTVAFTPLNGSIKQQMYDDLDTIKRAFETKYAMLEWKNAYAGVSLEDEIALAKAKVASLNSPTTKDFQVILRSFFNALKDYHVGVTFFSTEVAALPLTIKGAEGRYFISFIDTNNRELSRFGAEIGDEILAINDTPIQRVIDQLKEEELGNNTPETDQRLAELLLTLKRGDEGNRVPSGTISFTVLKKKEQTPKTLSLKWAYSPQTIADYTKLSTFKTFNLPTINTYTFPQNTAQSLAKDLFTKYMVTPSFLHSDFNVGANPNLVGARTSFIPRLGPVLWQSTNQFSYDAYIFLTNDGRQVGYVRIPHYLGDVGETADFERLMRFFNANTDALIIDQVNNPGGSLFYLYALSSMLTDKPIYAPKHRIALTQEEVFTAVTLLPLLEQVKTERQAKESLGDSFGGYPVSLKTVDLMKKFCRFLIAEWNQGHLLSGPTHIFGVDKIDPHPQVRYTKPLLLLINSLDFSGGDFFPSILKDAKRATILGTRTAGAGGYVYTNEYPNRFGVRSFSLTASVALRQDQMPLENLGVEPDILYEPTAHDLQNNYANYVELILTTLDSML